LQLVAIAGKIERLLNRRNTRNPLPRIARDCGKEFVVKSMFATACHPLPTIPYL
jgi:hypothetical protein